MHRIVAYSGGLSSFYTAKRVIDEHGKKGVQLVFTDTKIEDEDLYRFLHESAEHLGLKVTSIEDGRNPWEVFKDVRFMGNNRIDPCSRVLKRELFRKWIEKNYSPDECILYYGIGYEESHRIKNIVRNWAPYRIKAPLCKSPWVSQKEIIEYLERVGIKVPRLYEMGFPHNNCGGFCVKTGQSQFKLLYEKMPGRYLWHEAQQEELFKTIKPHGFIRRTVNGKMHYLSLKQFRETMLSGEQIPLFEYGGCGCMIGDE